MAARQIISLWSGCSGVGRRTLGRALAQQWAEEKEDTLLIQVDGRPDAPLPASWVPRFQALSPLLLRNFLMGTRDAHGNLHLDRLPEKALLVDMLALVSKAYSRIVIVGPAELSEDCLPILDASDLFLWVTRLNNTAQDSFHSFLDHLTKWHFPHTYAHGIVNRFSGSRAATTALPDIGPGKSALCVIAEEPVNGFRYRESIRGLAKILQGRPDLAKASVAAETASEISSEQAIEQIRRRIQPQLLKTLEEKPHLEIITAQATVEACLAEDATLPASREARGEILSRVMNDVMGLGPLEPLIKDPAVSEIMVNGRGCIYVEKKGKLYPVDIQFSSDKQLRTVIDRIVAPIGRRVDESMPLCDARLADGSRVNIVLPPLALDGPSLTIRKFSARSLGFKDLVQLGSLNAAMADFLQRAVLGHRNIVVAGGTGSGKTTLLNALSSAIPDDERIVTIEDAAELRLQKPHVVRLESRPPNAEGEGAIPIRRLVINALRMRPDRIVVGECRGGEALDMLQAMNTGHDGSMTTVHANAPRDALGRLETLVLMAGMDLPVRVVREQIRSAVHLIVQQARLVDGSRKITSITEVTGMEGDVLVTQEIFRFHAGQFESTGLISRTLGS